VSVEASEQSAIILIIIFAFGLPVAVLRRSKSLGVLPIVARVLRRRKQLYALQEPGLKFFCPGASVLLFSFVFLCRLTAARFL
jgi:hypothetical protein